MDPNHYGCCCGPIPGFNMKQEMIPNITLPNVSIITTYPGAAPDEVSEQVTIPIEQRNPKFKWSRTCQLLITSKSSSVQIILHIKQIWMKLPMR